MMNRIFSAVVFSLALSIHMPAIGAENCDEGSSRSATLNALPPKPSGCGENVCTDAGYDKLLHYAYAIYQWASDDLPESCARDAYLFWADFFVMQAKSNHDRWLGEVEARRSLPMPPKELGAPTPLHVPEPEKRE